MIKLIAMTPKSLRYLFHWEEIQLPKFKCRYAKEKDNFSRSEYQPKITSLSVGVKLGKQGFLKSEN